MLYIETPTLKQIGALTQTRADACVSIYLKTTPLTQDIGQARTNLGNLARTAVSQLEDSGLPKRRIWLLEEHLGILMEDDDFWEHQANSLAILVTPERIQTFRLANDLHDMVEVSDRFHLKPLLRAATFAHVAYVLAVSENDVRLIEMSANTPAREVRVPDMPKDAASAVGKKSVNESGSGRRIQGLEGQKVRLGQYVRKIDAALRPILKDTDTPVILASTLPMDALVRSLTALPLLPQTIETSPDQMTPAELAEAARPVLDAQYDSQIEEFRAEFEQRRGASRTTTDVSDAARAATFGGIDTLLVDFDSVTTGTVDEDSGAITFADQPGATSYGIIDEIAGRALRSGAHVMAVRRDDIPDGKELAAILRYPI
ncbi:hypothetical protein [Roseovarius dicentrarchi]|uniref:baeRF11 domain-containing protein n=1 Tax=Roseovarius dicentrarchi TaxID=2250573 RepID=UPI000DE9FFF7|nr:hypothetical protein [Roseovarius dicentrarchi]